MKAKIWTIVIVGLLLAGSWLYVSGFEFPWRGDAAELLSTPTSTPAPSSTKPATFTPTPRTSVTVYPKTSSTSAVLLTVPFAAQAPFGEWSDPRQQDGCEEASTIMAMHWVRGDMSLTLEEAKKEILAIADWEQEKYGSYHDTSTEDTVRRIFNTYYSYNNVRVENDIVADEIIEELEDGNLVIIPADGRALGNPYFTAPGPERHMLVIVGYDYSREEFITNDPGTRSGKNYRYKKSVLFNAVRDYATGDHLPIVGREKNIIVVEK